jgi:hypothetical protein
MTGPDLGRPAVANAASPDRSAPCCKSETIRNLDKTALWRLVEEPLALGLEHVHHGHPEAAFKIPTPPLEFCAENQALPSESRLDTCRPCH